MVTQTSDYIQHNGISHPKATESFYTLFRPEGGNIKATLLILHGMQEHSGRYTELAQYLAEQGLAVITYDHLGHGKTAKNREDLGFFQIGNPAQQVVNDAENIADYLEKLYPDVPHFLLGHSMGSFIARCLLQQAYSRFSGAIIVGTGGKVPGSKFGKAISALLNKITPHYRSNFINTFFNKQNNLRFKNEPAENGTNWLSVDRNNRQVFLQDELCGIPFSINGFYTLLSVNVKATDRHWAKTLPHTFPMLFISGSDDPIGNFGKGIQQTVSDLEQDGFKDISMKLYTGMRHEILNETDKQDVYKDIISWIGKHL
ncbi:alpha/beta fold hydrolase [Elizabethkingia ursingii]|uniref:alpha/beta fold hydrolase n=1 Tax=Elizabethkingia ursingii TaxID=1756150 RepID=UPI00201100F5|nr:alpha/beta hydrolase [Elizabethkingia ursingii]MCL1670629.1 lysophospholipase [Elizabethkingia ursingii]